jgi:phenylalanyl-tRNA synthetase alpha subunit
MEERAFQTLQLQSQRSCDAQWSITPLYVHLAKSALVNNVVWLTLRAVNKVRHEFRQIFFEMGFEEMPTNRYCVYYRYLRDTDNVAAS